MLVLVRNEEAAHKYPPVRYAAREPRRRAHVHFPSSPGNVVLASLSRPSARLHRLIHSLTRITFRNYFPVVRVYTRHLVNERKRKNVYKIQHERLDTNFATLSNRSL